MSRHGWDVYSLGTLLQMSMTRILEHNCRLSSLSSCMDPEAC